MFMASTFTKIFGMQWSAKSIVCEREPNNFQDRYAVAVKKENSTHLIFMHKAFGYKASAFDYLFALYRND